MSESLATASREFEIQRDIPCHHCRYNLRGLTSHSKCPECGTPISESLTDTLDSFYRSLPNEARRNLQVEVLHEPLGMWITALPFLIPFLLLLTGGVVGGVQYGPRGIAIGLAVAMFFTIISVRWLIDFRLRRSICSYIRRNCHQRRLNRCPLCYRDLSGDMAELCPECGCPVCIRKMDKEDMADPPAETT